MNAVNFVKPLNSKVLVEKYGEDQYVGQIVITSKKLNDRGIVLAVGPGRYVGDQFVKTEVKVGQQVIFIPNRVQSVPGFGSENYVFVDESDILAIVEEE